MSVLTSILGIAPSEITTTTRRALLVRSSERGEGFLELTVERGKDPEGFYIFRLRTRAGRAPSDEVMLKKGRWLRDIEAAHQAFDKAVKVAAKKGWSPEEISGMNAKTPTPPPSPLAAPVVLAHGRSVVSVVF